MLPGGIVLRIGSFAEGLGDGKTLRLDSTSFGRFTKEDEDGLREAVSSLEEGIVF